MQRGLASTLEHEENDQHSKEDIRGGVDSLEVKQGLQDAKMSKPKQSHAKKQKQTVAEWAPPDGATRERLQQLEKRRAPNVTVCTALVTAPGVVVHQTGGGGATAQTFQRAAKMSWGTGHTMVVHRPTHGGDHVSQRSAYQ